MPNVPHSTLPHPESLLTLTDVTTANASATRHGFLKKLSNNAGQYMDGTGNWTAPTATPSSSAGWDWDEAKAISTLWSTFAPVGDGTTNNTQKILDAVTATLASSTNLFRGYHVLYLDQAGEFLMSPTWTGISNLMILGENNRSIWVEGGSYFLDFIDCTRLALINLDWDLRGFNAFGGIKNESTNGMIFRGNHVFDSLDHDLNNSGSLDRFAIATTVSEATFNHNFRFEVEDNVFEDSQPSFGPLNFYRFCNNKIIRGGTVTAGVGFWANGDGWSCNDGVISGNKFIDCRNSALALNKDVASTVNTSWQRILISDNDFDFYNASPNGIFLGTALNVSSQTNDTFKNIYIVGNRFRYHESCPLMAGGLDTDVIHTTTPNDAASFGFENLHIAGNYIDGGWRAFAGMQLHRIFNSHIESNVIVRMRYSGIVATSRESGAANLTIRNNVVEVLGKDGSLGGAYALGECHGNVIFTSNKYLGSPNPIFTQAVDGTGNTIDTPVSANSYGQVIHFSTYGNAAGQQWNPASLDNGQFEDKDWTVLGVEPGDHVISFSMPTLTEVGWLWQASIPANDTVRIRIINNTGGTINLGAANPFIIAEKRMPPPT
jgi:hypothetical protein